MAFHVTMLLVVIACLGLGYWQLRRGEAGNLRSYPYAIEWPFFAGAAGYMWWRTMREDADGERAAASGHADGECSRLPVSAGRLNRSTARYVEPEPDPELDAYNAYLAELHRAALGRR